MKWLTAFLLISISSVSWAAPTQCQGDYFKNQAPDIVSNSYGAHVTELCFHGFAVKYSEVSNTPLWSAEHLTRERIKAAHSVRRLNDFHAERRLPTAHRATLADYRRSGYDRGHLSPSGDMASEVSDHDSFSLANMVPQNPDDNRHLWEGIEAATRHMAQRYGSIYVVTGPIFSAQSPKLHNRILVPTRLFKVVYVPSDNAAAAYIANNAAGRNFERVPLERIQKLTGFKFFPAASTEKVLPLFKPYIYSEHHGHHRKQ